MLFKEKKIECKSGTSDEKYIADVLSFVKWKDAHESIRTELCDHITEQKNAFLSEGFEEQEACQMAVERMGDVQEVGVAFDRAYRPKIEYWMLGVTLLLLSFGIFAWYACGMSFQSQDIIVLIIGAALLYTGCRFDYRKLFKHAQGLYILFVLGAILISWLCPEYNGRPIFLSAIRLNYYYLLFPLFFGFLLYDMKGKGLVGLLISGLLGAFALLIGLMDTIGTTIIPAFSCFIMVCYAVQKGWFGNKLFAGRVIAFALLLAIISFLLLLPSHSYLIKRFILAWNPSIDPTGYGYVGNIIQTAIEKSSWIGSTVVDKPLTAYLSEGESYYVLANLAQRYGLVLFLLAFCLILLFVWKCSRICLKQKDGIGQMLGISAISVLGSCFLIGLLNNLGFLVLPSIVLPFLAYGNIQIIFYLLYISVILSIFRYSAIYLNKGVTLYQGSIFSYQDGVLSIRIKG